jgi:hypothetical protein
MLLLAAALLAQGSPGDEIVITGRAQPLQLAVKLDGARRVTACAVTRSSGDPQFDQLACETVAACSREADRSTAAVQACARAVMSSNDRDIAAAPKE